MVGARRTSDSVRTSKLEMGKGDGSPPRLFTRACEGSRQSTTGRLYVSVVARESCQSSCQIEGAGETCKHANIVHEWTLFLLLFGMAAGSVNTSLCQSADQKCGVKRLQKCFQNTLRSPAIGYCDQPIIRDLVLFAPPFPRSVVLVLSYDTPCVDYLLSRLYHSNRCLLIRTFA